VVHNTKLKVKIRKAKVDGKTLRVAGCELHVGFYPELVSRNSQQFVKLLSFQRLLPGFSHVRGIPNGSVFSDGQDTFFAVRTENKGEYFRNRVVEFPASIGFFERTIGTTTELLIDITRADFAPMLPRNLFTTRAFPFLVLSASSAVQSAVGNQLRIVFDFGVHFTST